MEWMKVKTRELTPEERESFPGMDFMWGMEIPDEEEQILVSDGKEVWTDVWTYFEHYDCDFENTDFKDGEDLWYMPFPEPPKLEEV